MNGMLAFIVLWSASCTAQAWVKFGDYKTTEFAPSRGQVFEIPIAVEKRATIVIAIYSSDGDLVRTLSASRPFETGSHRISWDGKDQQGQVVPDEAYIPVLKARAGKTLTKTVDPRKTSGGEVIEEFHTEITASQDIVYTVPTPSRVLIRVGTKAGPMLRSLANWIPKGPGKNVQRWSGKDADGTIDLRELKDLTVLVTGFRLPDHAIITTGNRTVDYPTYRAKHYWPDTRVPLDAQILERNGQRLSKQYYSARYQDIDPQVHLGFPENLPRDAQGLPVVKVDQTVPVKVDIVPEHRWLMDESLYEVAFFIDQQFLSEEEQGYLPLTWHWKANGLSPGIHLLTVNISGFAGRVGISNLKFQVQP